MPRNKIGLQFEGFEGLIEELERVEGNVKGAVEECLQVSCDIVTNELETAMNRHIRTGKTKESIKKDNPVLWEGTTAEISVGFSFPEGLSSVFLMYGTPRMKKDQKVYNAIYGKKVRDKIAKKQEEILHKAVDNAIGG